MYLGPKEVVSNRISPMFHVISEAALFFLHSGLGYKRFVRFQIVYYQIDRPLQWTALFFQTMYQNTVKIQKSHCACLCML